MFKRILAIAATAVCLAVAAWLVLGFTKEQSAPRVGNFLCADACVAEAKIAPPKLTFPPYPHGKPLRLTADRNLFRIF